jgi:hypothetical protein
MARVDMLFHGGLKILQTMIKIYEEIILVFRDAVCFHFNGKPLEEALIRCWKSFGKTQLLLLKLSVDVEGTCEERKPCQDFLPMGGVNEETHIGSLITSFHQAHFQKIKGCIRPHKQHFFLFRVGC